MPLIVRWPGQVESGSVCSASVTSTDFYPTMLSMAGLALRPEQHVDGVNLVPLLKRSGSIDREAIYWHFPNYIGAGHPDPATPCSVIRMGEWKLIESLNDSRLELHNLREDLGETTDRSANLSERTRLLHEKLKQWRHEAAVQMPTRNPLYKAE